MMQLIRRTIGQAIRIQPGGSIDPNTPVGDLFAGGSIQLVLVHSSCRDVRVAVFANENFLIIEDELVNAEEPEFA